MRQQSGCGIANADARRFDQTTIFISRAANAVREFVYDDLQQSYTADALTFMARISVRNPVDLDVAIETETAQEALCIITNADGTLAVLSKVRRGRMSAAGCCGRRKARSRRAAWSSVRSGRSSSVTQSPASAASEVFDNNYRHGLRARADSPAVVGPATIFDMGPNYANKHCVHCPARATSTTASSPTDGLG